MFTFDGSSTKSVVCLYVLPIRYLLSKTKHTAVMTSFHFITLAIFLMFIHAYNEFRRMYLYIRYTILYIKI